MSPKDYILLLLFIVLSSLALWAGETNAAEATATEVVAEKVLEGATKVTESTEAVAFAFDKMEQYFNAAGKVIEQYGGDVAELGLLALRIDAITIVAPSTLWLLLYVTVLFKFSSLCNYISNLSDEFDKSVVTVFLGGTWFMLGIPTAVENNTFNVWAWAGIFYPELYAVHKFILN